MPAPISGALRRLGAAVREFTIAQRTLAIIGVAALVLGVVALGAWFARPAMSPLFSGLAPEDASAVVEQLQADGVPYELAAGGQTILVPEAQVYDERLKAAAAGLPTSSSGGYALLDTMGVTASEFQQSVTYKRALEGELAATIGAFDGVRTASVRLAIPEDTVFVEEQQPPTASVFVETEPGSPLARDQVDAIVHLTSASIEGLAPENVAVVAADGTVLSAVGVGATGGTDQQASEYETRVTAAVQSMLDTVVGAGNASVAVSAELSTESAERVEETFTAPEGGAPALDESISTEEYTGDGGPQAGVLGPDNIAVPAGDGGDGTYNAETTTRTNGVNKVTESRSIPAGAVTRQTVSVAIDADAAEGVNVGEITALVAAAAGIDPDRGDDLAVEVMPFSTAGADAASDALAEARADAEREAIWSFVRLAILVLGALAVVSLVAGLLARAARRRREAEPIDLGTLTEAIDPLEMPVAIDAVPPATAALPAVPPAGFEPAGVDRMRAEVNALAEASPERTAEYLRSLMEERQTT